MKTFQPYTVAFAQNKGDTVVFSRLDAEVRVPNPENLTWDFLSHCNGHRNLDEIFSKFLQSKRSIVEQIFVTLVTEKLIFDSRTLFQTFNDWSSIPMSTSSELNSEEITMLTKEKIVFPESTETISLSFENDTTKAFERKSVRSFTGDALTKKELALLLFSMYGINKSGAVASAGGLYSSLIYAAILMDGIGIKKGLYAYNHHSHSLLKIRNDVSAEKMISLFGDRMPENAGAILFLTSDVTRISKKYANRAYRYALLEAGHIAQNAALAVYNTRLGLCEYGGFNDNEVSRFLGLNGSVVLPMICITVGIRNDTEKKLDPYEDLCSSLEREVIKKQSIVDYVVCSLRSSKDYTMSVYTAETSKGKGKARTFCLGTGLTPGEATAKALAEAYERKVSSLVRVDFVGKPKKGSVVLDLVEICPQHQNFLKKIGLHGREENKNKSWTRGRRISGEEVLVPTDQVYFPVTRSVGEVTYFANSTGVATYSALETAVEKGMLELTERDAIACYWYSQTTPQRININTCSDWIQYRISEIMTVKREVIFLRLTLDLTPVVMCVIKGKTYPYFVTGSASCNNYAEAIDKALTEAELTLVSFLNKRRKKILAQKVWEVDDHAAYFAGDKLSFNDSFLKGEFVDIPTIQQNAMSIEIALKKLNPVIIRLDNKSAELMPVVRVISEKLIPITFGFGSEHYGHSRLLDVGFSWGSYPAPPHPLA